MIKKILLALFLIVTGLIYYNLAKQISDSLQAGQRLDQAIEDLTKLQAKNSQLKKRLTEINSPQFIEQQARDKLNLARPNETVVIIPQQEIDKVLGLENITPTPTPSPYYQGWLKLFLH